jgi:hypothetical protein
MSQGFFSSFPRRVQVSHVQQNRTSAAEAVPFVDRRFFPFSFLAVAPESASAKEVLTAQGSVGYEKLSTPDVKKG